MGCGCGWRSSKCPVGSCFLQNCYVESVSVYTHQCRSLPADSSSKRLMIITGSVWKLFLCIIDLCIYMYMLLLLVSLDFFFSLSIKKWSGWWVWGIHDRFHDFNILIMMHSSHEHKIYILVRTTIHMTHTPHKPPSQSRPSHGFCSKSVLAKSVLVSTCDGLLSTVRGAFITCRRGSPKHLIKILYDQHVQKIKRRNIYIYVITVEARTRTGLRKMIERIFFFF